MRTLLFNLWSLFIGDKSFSIILGLILLVPPIINILFFLLNILGLGCKITQFEYLSDKWYGYVCIYSSPTYNPDAGGFAGGAGCTSSLPLYSSFMGTVGAYLIKGTDNN